MVTRRFQPSATGGPASAVGPVSGASGVSVTSGIPQEWFIHEQELHYSYRRVPDITTGAAYSLSGNPLPNASVRGTYLEITYWGNVTKSKVFGVFNGSYTQPQRFEIISADSPSSMNGHGSSGTVHTIQKYYERRPWQLSGTVPSGIVDTEVSCIIPPTDTFTADYLDLFAANKDLPIGGCADELGWMVGEFDPLQTFDLGSSMTITDVGYRVQLGNIGCNDWVGCPDYDPTKHDYS